MNIIKSWKTGDPQFTIHNGKRGRWHNEKFYTLDDNESYTRTKITITLNQQLSELKGLHYRISLSLQHNEIIFTSYDIIAAQNAVECVQAAIDNLNKIYKA